MKNIATLVLLALAAACSSSSSTPGPSTCSALDAGSPTNGTPDTRPAPQPCDHAAALCTKLDQCAPFYLKAVFGDVVGCTDRLTKTCTAQSQSNGSGMTEAAILACEAALSTATCNDVFANKVPACTFHGTFADSATCGDNTQCASGFCNHGGSLCGSCAAKGAAGAACASGSNDECQAALVCSSGKVCVAPAAVGGACDDTTAPCLIGSFCTSAKTCALTVAVGADCPGGYLNFGDGTVCFGKSSATSPQTAAQIGTAGPGQICGLSPGAGLPATLCAPGGVAACSPTRDSIDLLGITTKGRCAALTQDSYQCAASGECFAGAQCIAGTCQIPSGRYCQ
jgi:hypothetical protein